VFGLKPTRGRTPTGPDDGERWRGAVVEHVITRSVRDSAAMLDAIAGTDPGAPYAAVPPERPYLEECATPPGRLSIAFSTAPMLGTAVHPDCVRAVTESATLLERLGHEVTEATLPVDREVFNQAFLTVVFCELAAELDEAARLLRRRVARTDVEASTWAVSLLGRAISGPEYSRAVLALQRIARSTAGFFERYPVYVTPTVAGPPFLHGALQPPPHERPLLKALGVLRASRVIRAMGALQRAAGTIFEWMSYTPFANATGQPAMSVPLSWNADGLPIGVHCTGRYGDEATLFRLAAQLEQAAPWFRRRPGPADPAPVR
jgi:amidase